MTFKEQTKNKIHKMQERKLGCICALDDTTGVPLIENYGECPVHKSEAPTPLGEAHRIVSAMLFVNQEQAKDCAMVCVDEILSIVDSFVPHSYTNVLIPFYKSVKEELKKL